MGKKPRDEIRQTNSANAVLSIALLVLAIVMIKSAFTQFFTNRIFGGCVNSLGGLLFFGISMILLRDLCKYLQSKDTNQEDSSDGC